MGKCDKKIFNFKKTSIIRRGRSMSKIFEGENYNFRGGEYQNLPAILSFKGQIFLGGGK